MANEALTPREKELEDALIELYKSSYYNLNEKTEQRVTSINNDKFIEIYKRINIKDLKIE